jgi:hypothetical protein
MLIPDKRFAQEFLDALDSRCLAEIPRCANIIGRDERCWLEQQQAMLKAVLSWLERWESNPRTACLREEGDPLWGAVNVMHDRLASSRNLLQEWMQEIELAAELVSQEVVRG